MKNSKLKNPGTGLLSAFGRVASVALFVSVLSVGSVAQAASIPMLRNVDTGETIFNDDFESYTVPTSPTALPLPLTANTDVGSWAGGTLFNPTFYTDGIANEARSASGTVAAQEGNNFLMMSGTPTGIIGPGNAAGRTFTGTGDRSKSIAGNTIEATIAFYLTTGSVEGFFYLYDSAGANTGLMQAIRLNGNNNAGTDWRVAAFDSNGVTAAGGFQDQLSLVINPDDWNTLKVSYVNGGTTMDISINDGTPVSLTGYQNLSGFTMDRVYFNQTTNTTSATTVYYDAAVIPEPSSIILMGMSVLVSMMMIGRRSRKPRC